MLRVLAAKRRRDVVGGRITPRRPPESNGGPRGRGFRFRSIFWAPPHPIHWPWIRGGDKVNPVGGPLTPLGIPHPPGDPSRWLDSNRRPLEIMGGARGMMVRGSESDRWKRGLLGRVDSAFFVRAQTTQVTQLLSVKGMSAKNYVCKNYVRREKDSAHTCHAEAPVG